MTKRLFSVAVAVALASTVFAAQGLAANKYVGAKGCKACHNTKKSGKQYAKWAESKHANAYEVLGTPKAAEFAKAAGVENAQADMKCLKCHVAGADAADEEKAAGYKLEDGVSCEACHGPGSAYKSMKIMKDPAQAKAAGLIMPDEKFCVTCHNEESPTFTGFDYKEMWPKIAHPKPAAE